MGDAYIEVRVFHWGDDNTDTTQDDFKLCPACFKSDAKFMPFILNKGFTLHPECTAKYNRFTKTIVKNSPTTNPPTDN
jgi:hypothetical protein